MTTTRSPSAWILKGGRVIDPGPGSGPASGRDEIADVVIADGSGVTADDVALFGRLDGLEKLQILNCREFDDAMVAQLTGLSRLSSLAITNSGVTDTAVEPLIV